MAQLVKHPTSAQVMISRSVGSSPVPGSVLTAQSLEPVADSVSRSLSAPRPLTLCLPLSLSLSLSKINTHKKNLKKKEKKIGNRHDGPGAGHGCSHPQS